MCPDVEAEVSVEQAVAAMADARMGLTVQVYSRTEVGSLCAGRNRVVVPVAEQTGDARDVDAEEKPVAWAVDPG